MNNNMNNVDINKLMSMLSKMDKKDLEKGLNQVSQMLGNSNKEELLKKLGNMNKNN